jgi:hypothetical protein
MTELLIILVFVGTSLWVLADASRIGARSGLLAAKAKTGSVSADYGPGGWFALCLLLWIIAFPVYLSKRSKIIEAVEMEKFKLSKPTGKPLDQVEAWAQSQAPRMRIAKKRPAADLDTVSCPECGSAILAAAIQPGDNVCQSCGGTFEASMS